MVPSKRSPRRRWKVTYMNHHVSISWAVAGHGALYERMDFWRRVQLRALRHL